MVHSTLLLFVSVTRALAVCALALGAVALLASSEELLQLAKVDLLLLLRVHPKCSFVLSLDPIAHEEAALLNDGHHDRRDGCLYDAVEKSGLVIIATRAQ
jgi:hypothetical protein